MPLIRLVSSCVPRSTSTPWANKVDVVSQCWRDHGLDVLGLTETWHEDADDVSLRRLRSTGLQMLERARTVRPGARTDDIYYQNYGGAGVVASSAVRLSKISAPFESITFEHLIARVTVSGSSYIFQWSIVLVLQRRPRPSSTSSACCWSSCHRSPYLTSSLAIAMSVSTVL